MRSKDGGTIATLDIDDWWRGEGRPQVDLLVIDITGRECAIVERLSALVATCAPAMVVKLIETGQCVEPTIAGLLNVLRGHGYHLFDMAGEEMPPMAVPARMSPMRIVAIHQTDGRIRQFAKADPPAGVRASEAATTVASSAP